MDDDPIILQILKETFQQAGHEVETADDGLKGTSLQSRYPAQVVVVDLFMPNQDGLETIRKMKKEDYAVGIIAISGETSGLPGNYLKVAARMGAGFCFEKPMSLKLLCVAVEALADRNEAGLPAGRSLFDLLTAFVETGETGLIELLDAEKKAGLIYIRNGEVYDAAYETLRGEDALKTMLARKDFQFIIKNPSTRAFKRRIDRGLDEIGQALGLAAEQKTWESNDEVNLLIRELDVAFQDELDDRPPNAEKESSGDGEPIANGGETLEFIPEDGLFEPTLPSDATNIITESAFLKAEGGRDMEEIAKILEEFKDVTGFMAVGVFTPQGELAAEFNLRGIKFVELGALANEVLLKAQKASDIMEIGRGNMVHVEAPKAQVIARCLNEATDFSTTASGRAHIHMVLILEKESSLAIAKMKLESSIQKIARFFR
jgi:DNA-binding response OmpR family regulator/predicted regulator of Ras-like GTPase activity (Roadblock/LC7/MglB family)